MAEAPRIPEFVRERLREQQAALRHGLEHPDADLLAAYSENLLSVGERSLVLNHLATCASCREVVMLAQSDIVDASSAVAATARPRLLRWGTLRWAALTACFALTIGLVLMERSLRQAKYAHMPATSERPAAEMAPNREEIEAQSEPAQEPIEGTAKSELRTDEKPAVKSFRTRNQNGRTGEPQARRSRAERGYDRMENFASRAKQKDAFVTAPDSAVAQQSPPATAVAVPSSAAQDRLSEEARQGTVSKLATLSPKPQTPSSLSSANVGAMETQPPGKGGEMDRTWLRDQEPGKKKTAPEAAPVVTASVAPVMQPEKRDKAAKPQSLNARSQAYNFETKDQAAGLTVGKENLAPALPTPTQWRIRGGKLQQSIDEGKTWQEIPVSPGITLHAFWTQGPSVWAGGSGGSLFHITEAGKRSVRIPIKLGDDDVSQTVVAVTFADEQHGHVMLENGQVLQTSDGGKTWQRQ
jgi:type II secretory pathway component PulJ